MILCVRFLFEDVSHLYPQDGGGEGFEQIKANEGDDADGQRLAEALPTQQGKLGRAAAIAQGNSEQAAAKGRRIFLPALFQAELLGQRNDRDHQQIGPDIAPRGAGDGAEAGVAIGEDGQKQPQQQIDQHRELRRCPVQRYSAEHHGKNLHGKGNCAGQGNGDGGEGTQKRGKNCRRGHPKELIVRHNLISTFLFLSESIIARNAPIVNLKFL